MDTRQRFWLPLLCTLLALLASCSSTGSAPNLGIVGRVVVDGPPETPDIVAPDGTVTPAPPGLPLALVAYDSQTLVAWGDMGIRAELFLALSGADLRPPVQAGYDRIVVRHRPTGFEWKGDLGARRFPNEARVAFKPGEAERWKVVFFDSAEAPAAPSPSGSTSTPAANDSSGDTPSGGTADAASLTPAP